MVKSIPASLTCEGDFEVLDIPTYLFVWWTYNRGSDSHAMGELR